MQTAISIKAVIASIFISLSALFGANTAPTIVNNYPIEKVTETVIEKSVPTLGTSISAAADFRSSLASSISSTATTMNLVSFTTGSESLVNGAFYGFKIGGREYVTGTASSSGTTYQIVNMNRGISRLTGTSTLTAYQAAWGLGTAVEQTDAPILLDHANKINGVSGFDSPIKYVSTIATSTVVADTNNLAPVWYAQNLAFSGAGAVVATQINRGYSTLATPLEQASSTRYFSNDTDQPLVLQAQYATSTCFSNTAALCGLKVVVTQNDGRIDINRIATSSLFANVNLTGTTTASGSTNIASTSVVVFTSSGTWTKKANLRNIMVELVGGGGNGGGASSASNVARGGGGGGGGYCRKIILAGTLGATETVTIAGAGGSTSFGSHCSATSGANGGVAATTGDFRNGGTGGIGSGGDINTAGGGGGTAGGSSYFGGGGAAADTTGNGGSAQGYGAGGGGAAATSGSGATSGGGGTGGVVVVTEVYF